MPAKDSSLSATEQLNELCAKLVDRNMPALPPARKAQVADEVANLIKGWLVRDAEQRSAYMKTAVNRALSRLGKPNQFSIRTEVPVRRYSEHEVRGGLESFFKRVSSRLASNSQQLAFDFKIVDMERTPSHWRTVSVLSIDSTRFKKVKNAVTLGKRKSRLKFSSVRVGVPHDVVPS